MLCFKELWIELQGRAGQIVSLRGHQNKAGDGEKKKDWVRIIFIGSSGAGEVSKVLPIKHLSSS